MKRKTYESLIKANEKYNDADDDADDRVVNMIIMKKDLKPNIFDKI